MYEPFSCRIWSFANAEQQILLTSMLIFRALKMNCIKTRGGGGVVELPCMGYIGMCRYEGYGFQAVYSRIRCINQSIWV